MRLFLSLALLTLVATAQAPQAPQVLLPHEGLSFSVPSALEFVRPDPSAPGPGSQTHLARFESGQAHLTVRRLPDAARMHEIIDQALADARGRGQRTSEAGWRVPGATRTRRVTIREESTTNLLTMVHAGERAYSIFASHPSDAQESADAIAATLDSIKVGAPLSQVAMHAEQIAFSLHPQWGVLKHGAELTIFPTDGRRGWIHIGAPHAEERSLAQWGVVLRGDLTKAFKDIAVEEMKMNRVPAKEGVPEGLRLSAWNSDPATSLYRLAEVWNRRPITAATRDEKQFQEVLGIVSSLTPKAAVSAASDDPMAGAKSARFPSRKGPPVRFLLPKGWTVGKPSSSMRLANITIAGPTPLEVAVFWFGAGGGGSLEANMDRWKGQFGEGSESSIKTFELGPGMKATILDMTGRFVAETRPGSGERVNVPGSRMLGAVLDVPQGPLFLKTTGPKAAVDRIAPAWNAWVKSFRRFP